MKRTGRRFLALGLASLLCLAVAAYADVFLLDFTGYDWTEGGDLGDPGSCYDAVGYVPAVNPSILNFDYANNEYTFQLKYSCFVSADTFGTIAVYNYGDFGPLPASFNVYCDALAGGTAGDYGANPPNASAPSTFIDGECVLGGEFSSNLIFVVDLTSGEGSMQGEIEWLTGTQLNNLAPNQQAMSLALSGLKFNSPNGPDGYFWQVDGQITVPEAVPTEDKSWGQMKTRYNQRGN